MILLAAAVMLALAMSGAWAWQRRVQNAGWADAFWSFGMGAAGIMVALAEGSALVAAVIGFWGARLGWHLAQRSRHGPEDSRYAHFRQEWGPDFERRLFLLLQIQAAAAWVLLLPVWVAARAARRFDEQDIAALAVVAVALSGEAWADFSLQKFRRNPDNRGKICDYGLWRLCRHPNYFCDWLFWFSYPLLALHSHWFWLSWVGPVLMYLLLVHVSGIPPLEARMIASRGDSYRAYQRRVSAFFPWPLKVKS